MLIWKIKDHCTHKKFHTLQNVFVSWLALVKLTMDYMKLVM